MRFGLVLPTVSLLLVALAGPAMGALPRAHAAQALGAMFSSPSSDPLSASLSATAEALQATFPTVDPGLLHSCASCAAFVQRLLEVAEAVHPLDQAGSADELSGLSLGNRALCGRFLKDDPGFERACEDVHDVYGLDHLKALAVVAPSLLCEHLPECGFMQDHAALAGVAAVSLAQDQDLLVTLGTNQGMDGQGGESQDEENDLEGDVASEGDLLVGNAPSTQESLEINAAAMEQQQMLEGQRMREQELREMDALLNQQVQQKLLAAQERNRQIRQNLGHLMKVAYRAQPGHCDCCGTI